MKHTLTLLWAGLELLYVPHRYPPRSKGLLYSLIAATLYLVWVHVIWVLGGFWVYPVLGKFGVGGRVGFCVAIVVLYLVFYQVGEFVNGLVHPQRAQVKSGKGDFRFVQIA